MKLKCSECGKIFLVETPHYKYKTYLVRVENNNTIDRSRYQCSYTCYDHAKLRIEGRHRTKLNFEKWRTYVINCEETMKAQGKTILNPIKVKR